MWKGITYMLLLLFNASRTLSYRSDLGVLESCIHGGYQTGKSGCKKKKKRKKTTNTNQYHMVSKPNLAARVLQFGNNLSL